MLRDYAGGAKRTALANDLTTGSASISVVDGEGYPVGGANGPFVVALSLGSAGEEKILVASRSGNTLTVAGDGRGYDGTVAATHSTGAPVDHVLTATDLREANEHVNDSTGDPHPQYLTAAEGVVLYQPSGDYVTQAELDALSLVKTIRVPHTFTVSLDVLVAGGDVSYIPPFFVPVPAGQTVTLVQARHRINSGTSATVALQKNGSNITGWTGIAVTPTSTTTDAADATFANGDALALVVTAVNGTPKNLTFTCYLDYSA